MVWYGMVWYGMIWYRIISYIHIHFDLSLVSLFFTTLVCDHFLVTIVEESGELRKKNSSKSRSCSHSRSRSRSRSRSSGRASSPLDEIPHFVALFSERSELSWVVTLEKSIGRWNFVCVGSSCIVVDDMESMEGGPASNHSTGNHSFYILSPP